MNRELSPLHGGLLEITLTVFLKNSKICICSRVSKLNVEFCISGYRAPPDSPGKNAEFNIKIYFPEYNPGTKLSYFESAQLFIGDHCYISNQVPPMKNGRMRNIKGGLL